MKKHFFITALVFFGFLNSVFARQDVEKKLMGSWQLVRTDSNGLPCFGDDNVEFYSFFPYKYCQINEQVQMKDSTGKWNYSENVYRAKWDLNLGKNKLSITKCHSDGLMAADQHYKIISVTDSTLLISYFIWQTKYVLHLIKAQPIAEVKHAKKEWKRNQYNLAQPHYVLINSADTNKRVVINGWEDISVTINEPFTDSTIKEQNSYTGGEISNLHDSILGIRTTYYKTVIKYEGDSSITHVKNHHYEERYVQTVNLHFVKNVSYSNSARSSWNAFSAGVLFYSILDILVVAPLVGINYKEGGFNSNKYFKWAGIGLIGFGVFLPVNLCSFPKKYFITQRNSKKDKHYWYFENEN